MIATEIVEVVALVLAVGLACDLAAAALRVPRMVFLLGAGMALGPHALDLVHVPLDSVGAELLFGLGVSFILFHGGASLSLAVLRPIAVGVVALAVPGILITTAVVGSAAAIAFDVSWADGLLIGAVLAPTDPAILIPLFARLRLRAKVAQAVVAESALNDATGAVLALALATYVVAGDASLADPAAEFAGDLAVSSILGLGFGLLLALAISTRRVGILRESPVIATLMIVATSFFTIESLEGSVYLGAFLAGLVLGNAERLGLRPATPSGAVEGFVAAVAEIAVVFVFVVLGANLHLDEIESHGAAALATVAVLVFVARPITVVACLASDRRARWTREELAFVAWSRETGVVPAALVAVIAATGAPHLEELEAAVTAAIFVTVLLQATTKRYLAARLGLDDGLASPPEAGGSL